MAGVVAGVGGMMAEAGVGRVAGVGAGAMAVGVPRVKETGMQVVVGAVVGVAVGGVTTTRRTLTCTVATSPSIATGKAGMRHHHQHRHSHRGHSRASLTGIRVGAMVGAVAGVVAVGLMRPVSHRATVALMHLAQHPQPDQVSRVETPRMMPGGVAGAGMVGAVRGLHQLQLSPSTRTCHIATTHPRTQVQLDRALDSKAVVTAAADPHLQLRQAAMQGHKGPLQGGHKQMMPQAGTRGVREVDHSPV